MDVILHLGAHRTASTSFQYYMRKNAEGLRSRGIGYWGPRELRNGLLTGVVPVPGRMPAKKQLARVQGRVSLKMKEAQRSGLRFLIISDENLIGVPRNNLRDMRLYPGVGERMARYHQVFGGFVSRAVLSIRAQESYWNSVLAYCSVRNGHVPSLSELDHIANNPRGWRDVVTDLACATPDVAISVMPHDVFSGRPECRLALMTGQSDLPTKSAREWLNRAPDASELRETLTKRGVDAAKVVSSGGCWSAFDDAQSMAMHQAYSDDIYWLRAGANGLATLTEEFGPTGAGLTPSVGAPTRGQGHGNEERRMA